MTTDGQREGRDTAALDYFRREGWNMYRVDGTWTLIGHAIFAGRKP